MSSIEKIMWFFHMDLKDLKVIMAGVALFFYVIINSVIIYIADLELSPLKVTITSVALGFIMALFFCFMAYKQQGAVI